MQGQVTALLLLLLESAGLIAGGLAFFLEFVIIKYIRAFMV